MSSPPSVALAFVVVREEPSSPAALPASVGACGLPAAGHVIEELLLAAVQDVVVLSRGRDEPLTRVLRQRFGEAVQVLAAEDEGALEIAEHAARKHGGSAVCVVLDADLALMTSRTLLQLAELTTNAPLARVVAPAASDSAATASARAPRPRCIAARIDVVVAALRRDGSSALLQAELGEVGDDVREHVASDPNELLRANDRVELAKAEELLYARIADEHRRAGALVRSGVRIDRAVTVAKDAILESGVVLRGTTRIGAGARIDVGCVLTDVEVAPRVYIKPYSVATSATIGEATEIGPFSHLRPDTRLGANVRIGNFVETKNMIVGDGAMANHLAFLGDGELGARANIGAGTIFCNSDGVNKFRTEVGPGAFVGSGCQLVAPIKVGAGAFIATGTTVTEEVPDDALAIGRAKQQNKPGYAKTLRARFAEIAAKLSLKR